MYVQIQLQTSIFYKEACSVTSGDFFCTWQGYLVCLKGNG